METDTELPGEEFFEVKQAGRPNEAAATDVAAGSDEASDMNELRAEDWWNILSTDEVMSEFYKTWTPRKHFQSTPRTLGDRILFVRLLSVNYRMWRGRSESARYPPNRQKAFEELIFLLSTNWLSKSLSDRAMSECTISTFFCLLAEQWNDIVEEMDANVSCGEEDEDDNEEERRPHKRHCSDESSNAFLSDEEGVAVDQDDSTSIPDHAPDTDQIKVVEGNMHALNKDFARAFRQANVQRMKVLEKNLTRIHQQLNDIGLRILSSIRKEYRTSRPTGNQAYWKNLRFIIDEVERFRHQEYFARSLAWLCGKWQSTPRRVRRPGEPLIGSEWVNDRPKSEPSLVREQWNVVSSAGKNTKPQTFASAIFKLNRSASNPLATTRLDLEEIFPGSNTQDNESIQKSVGSRKPEGSTRWTLEDIQLAIQEDLVAMKTRYEGNPDCANAIEIFEKQVQAMETFLGAWGLVEFSKTAETMSNELRDRFAVLKRTCALLWDTANLDCEIQA